MSNKSYNETNLNNEMGNPSDMDLFTARRAELQWTVCPRSEQEEPKLKGDTIQYARWAWICTLICAQQFKRQFLTRKGSPTHLSYAKRTQHHIDFQWKRIRVGHLVEIANTERCLCKFFYLKLQINTRDISFEDITHLYDWDDVTEKTGWIISAVCTSEVFV